MTSPENRSFSPLSTQNKKAEDQSLFKDVIQDLISDREFWSRMATHPVLFFSLLREAFAEEIIQPIKAKLGKQLPD